ncbi:MarR family transcriptional regulator [Planosporangium thailandense]|uniref:MarR family transcriptional regulator n=1 Tax=Planosporangium thailandense TaxID=765197 RepID=A0ABX0XYY0_9ACTN|nr:MarR family transcriptional regulator [Planosporangium thailandense]
MAASLERVTQLVGRLASTRGISLATAATLRTLQRRGPCRLSELAVHEGITQPAMTQLVSRMERDGYVERRSCADDARVVLVHLTPAGEDLIRRRRDERARRLTELAGRLAADDRAAIAAALPALERLIAAHTPRTGAPEA